MLIATTSATTSATTLALRPVGELVASLPGAAGVLRRFRFDFCCGLDDSLATLATTHDTPLAVVTAALESLPPSALVSAPKGLEALLGHILSRYHLVHRQELPRLIRLAALVEHRHEGHPDVPFGLADVLAELQIVLDAHMRREETRLFPQLRRGSRNVLGELARVRQEHDELVSYLCCLETVTAGHRPPADASARWRELYAGTEKLVDDLIRHRHLESDLLGNFCHPATISLH